MRAYPFVCRSPHYLSHSETHSDAGAFQATFALTGVYAVYGCAQLILVRQHQSFRLQLLTSFNRAKRPTKDIKSSVVEVHSQAIHSFHHLLCPADDLPQKLSCCSLTSFAQVHLSSENSRCLSSLDACWAPILYTTSSKSNVHTFQLDDDSKQKQHSILKPKQPIQQTSSTDSPQMSLPLSTAEQALAQTPPSCLPLNKPPSACSRWSVQPSQPYHLE